MAMPQLAQTQRLAALDKLYSDINAFLFRARSAALALCATSAFDEFSASTRSFQRHHELTEGLYTDIRVVDALRDLWRSAQVPPFDQAEVDVLSSSLRSCDSVLDMIENVMSSSLTDVAVRSSDGTQHDGYRGFKANEVAEAKRVLQACFRTVTEATYDAKTRKLHHRAALTNKTPEHPRVKEALGHPYLHNTLGGLAGEVSATRAPKGTNTPPPCDPSLPFRPLLRNVPPHFLPRSQPQPPPSIINHEYCEHRTLATMADESDKNDAAQSPSAVDNETPQDTPASTRENTPVPEPTEDVEATADKLSGLTEVEDSAAEQAADRGHTHGEGTSQVVQPTATPGAPRDSTIAEKYQKAIHELDRLVIQDSGAKNEEQTPKLPPASSVLSNAEQTTTATLTGPPHHFEAYILRPHVESFGDSITWTTKIQLLHLDEASMRAHLNKLGPDYSVIDALAGLLPEQLRLTQECTKSRNGRLVSVQQGAPADMVTQMGTFKIKSVVFVISIATLQEKEDRAEKNEWTFAKAQSEIGKQAPDTKGSLFGTTPAPSDWTQLHKNGLFSGAPVKKAEDSLFRGFPNLQPSRLEPTNVANPFKTSGPVPAAPTGAPMQPATQSQGQNDFVPFEEEDHDCRYNARSRYMTITFNIPYRNTSFEELRVADYAAGRTGSTKVEVKCNTWGQRMFSDDKPFGGQDVHYKVPSPPRPSAGGLFGGGQFGSTPARRGLFGGFKRPTAPSDPSAQPTGGLFGSHPATIGPVGAFGTPNNAGAGLFDHRANPSASLFDPPIAPPPGLCLFPQQPKTKSTGPFAQNPTPTPGGGLFGGAAARTSGNSLFGQPQRPTASPSDSGLFKQAPKPSSGGLFGGSGTATSGNSLFGQPPKPTSTRLHPASNCYLFRQPPHSTSSSLFGQPAAPASGSSVFGQPQKPTSTSLFVQAPAPAVACSLFGDRPKPSVGLFGQPLAPLVDQQPRGFVPQSCIQPNPLPASTGSLFDQFKATASNSTPDKPAPRPNIHLFTVPPVSLPAESGLSTACTSTTGGFGSTPKVPTAGPSGFTAHVHTGNGSSGFGARKPTLLCFCDWKTANPKPVQAQEAGAKPPREYVSFSRRCEECGSPVSPASPDERANELSDESPQALCDACKAKKETSCWLCEKKVEGGVKTEGKKKELAEEGDYVPKSTHTPALTPAQAAPAAPVFGQAPAHTSTYAPTPAPAPAAPQINTAQPAATESEKKTKTKFYADKNGAVWSQLGPHPSAHALPSLNPFTTLNNEQSAAVPNSGFFAGFGANSTPPVPSANLLAGFGATTPASNALESSAAILPFGLPWVLSRRSWRERGG